MFKLYADDIIPEYTFILTFTIIESNMASEWKKELDVVVLTYNSSY
jgi:hypothetical protein